MQRKFFQIYTSKNEPKNEKRTYLDNMQNGKFKMTNRHIKHMLHFYSKLANANKDEIYFTFIGWEINKMLISSHDG